MKPCFNGLVGLSELECECFEIADESLKSSKLNLFVDDLEGIDLQLIQNAVGCGEELGTSFERMYKSAVNFFESDLQVAIGENYKQKNKTYTGKIGETKYTGIVQTSIYAGLKLKTQHVEGAAIVISSIGLFFNNTGTIVIEVYKNDEKLSQDYTIEITQEKQNFNLPSPLILPIVENGIRNDYHFVYQVGAMQPMNNKSSCGCSGVETLRSKFLTAQGIKTNSLAEFTTDNSHAFGLSLNAVISCSIDNLICSFMDEDIYLRRSGMALWYKMGVLMIEKLFASREINFDTFSDREYLYGRKKKFQSNYNNLVMWLSENSRINESNCFICDSTKVMTMGKNLI